MPETTETPTPPVVMTMSGHHDPYAVAPAWLACAACGCRIDHPMPSTIERVTANAKAHTLSAQGLSITRDTPTPTVTAYARCTRCLTTRDRARELLADYPEVRRVLGPEAAALASVEATLHALNALDLSAPSIRSTSDLVALVRSLSFFAVAAFSRRASGTITAGAAPGREHSAAPWSHLAEETRSAVRSGYAALLHDRLDYPRPLTPPDDDTPRGCLFCGVDTVTAKASQRGNVWHRRAIRPALVGGRLAAAEPVEGHLCPACNDALTAQGAVGPTAVERAFFKAIGFTQRPGQDVWMRGAPLAWLTLTDAAPNAEPWAHIGDHDKTRRGLIAASEGRDE